MFKFQKLIVWQKSTVYSLILFRIAEQLPQRYQFSFGEQLRRATLSITNNIAEGSGRKTKKESVNFYNISKGSVYETVNIILMINLAKIIEIKAEEINHIVSQADELCRMLGGLIKSKLNSELSV